MSYQIDPQTKDLVISGWERGIAHSPFQGIGNMRNLNVNYYPGVAYVNYERQACTLSSSIVTSWYAGAHSTNVSNNTGWLFEAQPALGMTNPVQSATSPAGINYILDDTGQIWKQSAKNSSTFNLLGNTNRYGNGAGGLAYWNNYLVVFGDGLIEFCGDGTGDSTITGDYWNYLNHGAIRVNTITAINELYWNATLSIGDTSATLEDVWVGPSGNFNITLGDGSTTFSATFTNGSTTVTWVTGLSSAQNPYFTLNSDYILTLPNSISDDVFVGDEVTFTTTGTLFSPITTGTPYYITNIEEGSTSLAGKKLFSVSATPGGNPISITSAGSPTNTMTDNSTVFPWGNCTDVQFTFSYPITDTTNLTLTSYVAPNGITIKDTWVGPTGFYELVSPWGDIIFVALTTGSNVMQIENPPVQFLPTGTYSLNLINSSVTQYRPYVSKVDGNLYFSNGRYMGTLIAENTNTNFNPGEYVTFSVNYGTFSVVDPNDTIVDMIDLLSTMVVAGQQKIYTWDYVSATTSAPIPINEPIIRLENLLNNVYVFTNQKGNIYISNGSYAQYLMKIPDGIVNTIDPVWTIGDVMVHRSRLYFHAVASDTSGNNLLRGVFSIIVSPSLLGEIARGINMESQGSAGLVPAAGSTSDAVLINNEPSSDGQDSYYCAYSTGASSGVIDYNDTTLWSNGEPAIETDMIPIGTILTKRTLGQVQFKLDRPMATGDSISLYARSSLSDTYTLVGTTTSEVLSDYYPSNLFQGQWLQFKITFSCAATGSSFIPLREVRVQFNG